MIKLSEQLINSLGLSEAEAEVYVASLELGQANIHDLAQKSGVKRTSIYNFIEDLKKRGFLQETKKGKRRVYSAAHPEQLLEIEKIRISELQRLIPELLAIQNIAKDKPRVTFYDGVDGIKEVYADMLRDKKEIIAFEDLEHMKRVLPKSFFENFPEERARKEILFKSILRDSSVARELTKKNFRLLRDSKFIKTGDWKTEINIYGDKTALMSFRTKHPFCVLIEDHNITETLRTAWRELWDRL